MILSPGAVGGTQSSLEPILLMFFDAAYVLSQAADVCVKSTADVFVAANRSGRRLRHQRLVYISAVFFVITVLLVQGKRC